MAPLDQTDEGFGCKMAEAERYRCGLIYVVRFGNELRLVNRRAVGRTALLHRRVVDILGRCQTFRTLDEHAERVWNGSIAQQPLLASREEVRRELAIAAESGLLIGLSEVMKRLAKAGGRNLPSIIGSLGVLTADTPVRLERAVASVMENVCSFGRRCDVVVADASCDTRISDENRAALGRMRTRYGLPIRYAGAREKRRFVELLSKEGDVPPSLMNFALGDSHHWDSACGANRNSLLLDTAGDLTLSLDDDVVCDIRVSGKASDTLAFTSTHKPHVFRSFRNRTEAEGSLNIQEQDLLAMHEQLLGRASGAGLGGVDPGQVDLQSSDACLLEAILSGDARVIATMAGLFGGPGMQSVAPRTLTGTWQRGTESEESCETVPRERCFTQTASCTTISNGTFFVAKCLGLDNREPIPPFLPGNFNADSLSGVLLRLCHTNSLFGYLRPSLFQVPRKSHTTAPESSTALSGMNTSETITAIIQRLPRPNPSSAPAGIFQHIGDGLRGAGTLPDGDFCELLELICLEHLAARICELERFVSEESEESANLHPGPSPRSTGARATSASIRTMVQQPSFIAPRDLMLDRSPQEALALVKRITRHFGELLCAWPELVKVAQRLRRRERQLAAII